MKKRFLALMLAILAVCPLLIACSGDFYSYDSYKEFITLGNPENVIVDDKEIEYDILGAWYDYFADEISAGTLKPTELKTGTVQYGDTVNIDYKGYKLGEDKPFEGGSTYDATTGAAKGTDLEIGSDSYIPGFETAIIGHEVGEQFPLYITFPETYGTEELAGQRVRFDIVINKIKKRYTYPELTDAKVKEQSAGEFESKADFEKHAKEEAIKNAVWQAFYESCTIVKWPKKEVEEYYYNALEQYKQTAYYIYGDFDKYAQAMGYSNGNGLRTKILNDAKQQAKQDVMVLALVEEYNIDIDLDAEMRAIYDEAKANGYKGSYRKYLKDNDESAVRIAAYTESVMDFLRTKNQSVDTTGKNGFFGSASKGYYYYINDEKQLGWVEIDPEGDGEKATYYFNPELDGRAFNNVAVKMKEKDGTTDKYLKFGKMGLYDGVASNEMINDGNGYLYIVDNAPLTGLQELDRTGEITGDEQYYFGTDGYLWLGVKLLENDFGAMNGKYYDFGTSGIVNFDTETGEKLYGDNCKNALASGMNGDCYYENGEKKTNYLHTVTDDATKTTTTYYYKEDGKMAKGEAVTVTDKDGNQTRHYFDTDGTMVKGKTLIKDGVEYVINKDGVVTSEKKVETEGEGSGNSQS